MKPHSKRFICFLIALILCNAYLPIVAAFAGYRDVPQEYWASEYIRELEQLGYTQDMADGAYDPEKPVTNAEFTALVCRMTGMDDTVLERGAHWAEAAMEYAKYMGWFTQGEVPGADYDEPISREMAAKILMLGFLKIMGQSLRRKLSFRICQTLPKASMNMLPAHIQLVFLRAIPTGHTDPKTVLPVRRPRQLFAELSVCTPKRL